MFCLRLVDNLKLVLNEVWSEHQFSIQVMLHLLFTLGLK